MLVGLETDVCVAQSALGLLDRGLSVVVVEDAVARRAAHAAGLDRMRRAGAIPVVTKQLHYEWMRTVELSRAVQRRPPRPDPATRRAALTQGLSAASSIRCRSSATRASA